MIVDSFTFVWESPEQVGKRAPTSRRRDPLADRLLHADPLEHFESLGPIDIAMVYSFESRLLDAKVSHRLVSGYVRNHPDRLIGVAGIDPLAPWAFDTLDDAVAKLAFKAVAISPSAQGFHPMDSRLQPFYRELVERNLPLIVHDGPVPSPAAKLELADPVLLDEVLREHPGLKLVLGDLGGAWLDHKLALMAKHGHVLASLGTLLRNPWQAYNALVLMQESALIDRVLFASGFPFAMPVASIETLYSMNRLVQGSNLPTIPRELLRGIVERDTLGLLGIESPRAHGADREAAPAPAPASPEN
ncbi:MAG: amidohydrolase family protein [Phycisphaerae bacterium]|nr:amidohydrolase family protein [Phycisphaerae bacterium]